MTSRKLKEKLRGYGATISDDGRTLRLAADIGGTGGPAVRYRVALDGSIDRRTQGGEWQQTTMDEQAHGVLAMWLSEPIPMISRK